MKRGVIFGVLFAALGMFGVFDVVQAGHTVTGVTPSSIQQQVTSENGFVTITLGGTLVTPAISPIVNFKKGATSLSASFDSFNPNAPSPFTAKVVIPALGAAVGKYTVEFCYVPGGVGSLHCASKANAFEVKLAGSVPPGPGTPPGAGVGGEFVEAVPTRYGGIPDGPQTGNDFISLVEGITNWIFALLLVVAVIFIVLAGFQFIVGGGDPQAVAQARTKLIWAVVGILVAVLARGIPVAIRSLIGT